MIRRTPTTPTTEYRPDSIPGRILAIVRTLWDVKGHRRLTLEQITVACWQQSPEVFGMDGYAAKYPDIHTVRCAFYGPRGLLARGYFRKVALGRVELTDKGRGVEPKPVVPVLPARVKTATELGL